MAGKDSSRYQPGLGLPPYLLSRNYADSSTDSDGASRIFAASNCSITSDKDTESSSVSHMPPTFSYMSTSSSFTWSDTTSISTTPSTFQYETSSASRSIDDETRTVRSETFSMGIENPSCSNATGPIYEDSSATVAPVVSSIAVGAGLFFGALCLANTNESNNYISPAWDYNAPAVSRVEDMFTPYVSVLSNDDNQSHHGQNESSDEMATENVQIVPNTTNNVRMAANISYNECCLSGDTTIHECGPTTRLSLVDNIASLMSDGVSISVASQHTTESEFVINDQRARMNRILSEFNLSPIRSQATTSIKNQSKSGLRRLVSKFTRGSKALQEKLAETLVPGQGQDLIEMAQLRSQAREEQQLQLSITNEMVQSLKQVYDIYVKQKMPFIDQVRLLSLLPRSWKYEKVMDIFECTRHAVKVAHQMYDDEKYILNRDQELTLRQRADPEKIRHFVTWLVESNTLVSGTYGLTTLRMDNGEKYELPKQIIQSQRSHALVDYKKYCDETGFHSLGKSKLYDIIDGIKPAQQRTVAGLDEFVVEGIEAWRSLSNITESMAIPQNDRKRLIKRIDMAEQYQKIRHSGHCSHDANCITHCTTFGLSDSKCTEHHSNCNHAHTTHCPDCINIIVTLDEISQHIQRITDKDIAQEARFDFENASEHIVEWSRHNLRAARQDAEKKSIVSQMNNDDAFCTFDRGMSVLVGSFVWKDSTTKLSNTATTTTSLSPPTYSTESYIVAITDAAQTELDTLSAGEIITKQFKTDYPHIKKLHKRTDNAGNFSSHATPEVGKLIGERLNIELLTRDYSEVQKGKDICDRVCGVAKARMRSWIATGNDLLNAIDIKEGMEYAGGINNTKISVVEIVPDQGHLDKTSIPNVSTLRSIRYTSDHMKVYKASNIGTGISIPYKQIDFETNMRIMSPFDCSIDKQQSSTIPKQRNDRKHHFLILCPVSDCTASFESNADLESHIAANLHNVPDKQRRTANDIARLHLTELIRTTAIDSQQQVTSIFHSQDMLHIDLTKSVHYEKFSSVGWGLRSRKHRNPMSENVKNFMEKLWIDSRKSHSKLTPQQIQQQIRTKRDDNGEKLFQTNEYPTLSQIKYRSRKIAQKHDVTPKQELIAEIMEMNTE
ncbi:unnamed protein product [Rotaria magnacalcarata]|uniref:C2H2-type domain-containing protein n=3 Tax=Rotaria magnacalcarata TaxID=392030 RepID=A0A816QEE7_9BILA|nr:unnamed protein product [Rotaria magnacalcarata]